MKGRRLSRLTRFALAPLLATLAAASVVGLTSAQNPTEREVKPQINVQDTDDVHAADSKVWVLNFVFKDPPIRQVTVEVPGKGRRVCHYLWYQVINYSSEPHTFYPEFTLKTQDKETVHVDQVLPKVQDAIRLVEDPTDYYKIKNSVTMSAEPIPPSKKDAAPRKVTGVAIWDDLEPDTNRFSIFVTGLSNGWSVTDPAPGEKDSVVRRKTLQLNFRRAGDPSVGKSQEIKFVGPAEWKYIGTKIKLPESLLKEDKKPAAEPPPDKQAAAPPSAPRLPRLAMEPAPPK
jgi:hypothetical protein